MFLFHFDPFLLIYLILTAELVPMTVQHLAELLQDSLRAERAGELIYWIFESNKIEMVPRSTSKTDTQKSVLLIGKSVAALPLKKDAMYFIPK